MEDSQKKSIRLQQLHRLFNEHLTGYKSSELATQLAVSNRTIERDLEELQGWPMYLPLVQERWVWRLDRSQAIPLPPVTLTREQATALFLGARLLSQHSGKLKPVADSAISKLAQALPPEVGQFLLQPPAATDLPSFPTEEHGSS